MTKIIHSYDPVSLQYIGEIEADESPLEPGVYLVPAFATELAPPSVPDGQIAVFREGTWTLVPDVRGQWFDAQGRTVAVAALDEDVQGLTRVAPPDPDHDLVDGRWVRNSAKRFANKAAALKNAVQSHLDERAQEQGYDNILTAVSYADELAVAKFKNEGRAFRAWRSRVWAACYQLLDDVGTGKVAEPASAAELIAQLPALELPQ